MNELVNRAITAIKSGDKASGKQLLMQALQVDRNDVNAWLWMSATVESDEQRRRCLEEVLRIQPGHPQATAALARLDPARATPPQAAVPSSGGTERSARPSASPAQPTGAGQTPNFTAPFTPSATSAPTAATGPLAVASEMKNSVKRPGTEERPAANFSNVSASQAISTPVEPSSLPAGVPAAPPRARRGYAWYEIWMSILLSPSEKSFQFILTDPKLSLDRGLLWIFFVSLIQYLVVFGLVGLVWAPIVRDASAEAGLPLDLDAWLRTRAQDNSVKKYAGVYNAALELPQIQAKLKKPPVELNNVKWLLCETGNENLSGEKLEVARLAMETGGSSPQKVAKIIKSVYGDDYARINSSVLGDRLNLSSGLLHAAEARNEKKELGKEVMGNLQARLDQVKDHVLDDLQVREDTGHTVEQRQTGQGLVHAQVYRLVSFYKGRSAAHKKMVGLVHKPIAFEDRDYDIISKDFRISREDAEALVRKLKDCFDADGGFKKSAFGEAIAHFRQYESKIFGFLWHHMKDAILPKDRVAFLNALQTLTARMHQPKRALKVLLEDICGDPEKILFSDNKAVMLANLIVHRPDKALADYEITPEEVILNRRNLDPEAVQYAAWRIDKDKEQFLTKVQSMHKKLSESLSLKPLATRIPTPIMLNLERELYIFLALVNCETGKSVLRSAIHEYGDPSAAIYHLKESERHLPALLQNLRIVLRGLGVTGGTGDFNALEAVKEREETFQRLKNDKQYRAQARLITEWVDEAIKLIKFHQ